MKALRRSTYFAYLSIPVFLYCFIILVPVAGALYYSLFNWAGGPKKTFIGVENFITLASDKVFWQSFLHNIEITVICIIGQIGLALILALVLNSRGIKLRQMHLSVAYFPAILSAVVVGFIWQMLYDYNNGLINDVLAFVGLDEYIQPWLANADMALILSSIPLIWKNIGYYMIIILAGLAALDSSVIEVAEIDGANALQRLMHIVMPMIRNTLIVCLTLCISGNMKIFDHIYVMTGGGPGNATNVMALYAYQNSFIRYRMGYGSAVSVGILILSILITVLVRRATQGRPENE